MAVYQRRFMYNNRNSNEFGLRVVTFSPDDGETDSYLSMESVFTDNFNGTMRHDYGAKYNSPVVLYITMVKNNYKDFSRGELREALDWLTGLRKVSWLDLYNDDTGEITFSFLGRITDVKLQKMDARVIGIKAEFTSVSPWAYSGIQRHDITLDGTRAMYPICNASDEDSVYVYPKVVFINKQSNGTLRLFNTTTREETLLKNLKMNEVITLDSNKIIYSDNDIRVFGEDFNSQWLRFIAGYNHITMTGVGHVTIEHRDIFKVADAFDDNDQMNIAPADRNVLLLTYVDLKADNWVTETLPPDNVTVYTQELNIEGITEYSKVDLQATEEQLLAMQRENIEIQVINTDGIIKAYSYILPSVDYTLQATVEETDKEVDRRHGTVTLYADAWYNQGDIYYQPVYIKDVTRDSIVHLDLTDDQIALLEDNDATLFIKNERGETIAYAVGYKPDYDYTAKTIIMETTRDMSRIRDFDREGIYAEPLYF